MLCSFCEADKKKENLEEVTFAAPASAQAIQAVVKAGQPSTELAPPKGKLLRVCIVSARGIRNADWAPRTGKSDAFVTVDFVGGSGGFKTPVIKDSLQPVWQHEGELQLVPDGAALDFTVWDQDLVGKELLGRARLNAAQYEKDGFHGELLLSEAGEDIQAYLKIKVKVPGKDYPKGLGAAFSVVMEKKGKPVGIDLDILDGKSLQICGITKGVFETYNKVNVAAPEVMLDIGLYIMSVNGVSNNAADMLVRLKEDNKLTLLVRRQQVFAVTLEKKVKSWGLDINYSETGIGVLIQQVLDGPVSEWNALHKETEIKPGDRVVSANGISGITEKIFNAIRTSDKLHLVISRPAPDSWFADQ